MAKPKLPNFGIQFPENMPLMHRHLHCAYNNTGFGSFYHRRAIIRALWPEEILTWHEWSDRRLRGTCNYKVAVWVGAGASGKSTDAAAQAIEWWLENPMHSAVLVCSTTIKMLRLRIWSEVARLFKALPKFVEFRDESGELLERFNLGYLGELVDSDLMVRWQQGDPKHAILGIGVNEGSVVEAVSNLVGVHAKRVWLMLDEMQGVREAIDSAKDNMSKNEVFQCLGMGNTDENMKSLLRRAAQPKNGWDSVDVTTADEWETDGGVVADTGICQRFDGRKSPAIKDPEKFKFLIGQTHIDKHIRKAGGNLNDPGLCSQCFAIWPATGIQNTVLDEAIIQKFRCHEDVVWTNGFSRGAALDPAFTDGGDRKILQFFRFGQVRDEDGERWVIKFDEWLDVPIDSRNEEPVHYQIVHYCMEMCGQKGVTSDDFALDSSGEGGGLKAIFDTEWGKVMGVEFGGSPSETPAGDERTAKDVYDRRVSELNFALRTFAQGNGIRGLSKEAAEQACTRRTLYKNKKNTVEKKADMRLRTGESPDHCDAVCVALAFCQEHGARPGGEIIASRKMNSIMQRLVAEGARMIGFDQYNMAGY